MMQIVSSTEGKLVTQFPWATLISIKYNLSIQYFVNHSWRCQQKYLTYAYDPYVNRCVVTSVTQVFRKAILDLIKTQCIIISFLPADPEAECIVSLAVCDMTRKGKNKISAQSA